VLRRQWGVYSGGSVLGAAFVFFQACVRNLVADSFGTTPLAQAVGRLTGNLWNGEFSEGFFEALAVFHLT